MSLIPKECITFEGYTLDRSLWRLTWGGEPIALAQKTFDLLIYLLDRRDRVVGKEELLQALWPKLVVEESNLSQQVFLLRKALSRHESGAKLIETVAGRGYRFSGLPIAAPATDQPDGQAVVPTGPGSRAQAAVDGDLPIESDSVPAPASPVPSLPVRAPFARRKALFVGVAFLVLACGILGWNYWRNRTAGPPVDVVLADFQDTGDASLNRALNDALRIDLNQSPFLTVISPGKVRATLLSMRQPDAPMSLAIAREVCERLAAQVLLQGAVTQFGQKYLVSLRANTCASPSNAPISGADSEVLAEEKSEVARLDDLPQAIDGLAAKIRRELGESRASLQRFDKPLFAVNTGSLAALKAFSEGSRLAAQGNMNDALPLYDRAVALDPEFAVAYYDEGAAYLNLGDLPKAREAVTKAYAVRQTASELLQLYIAGTYHDVVTGDTQKSLDTFKTMVALYPRSAAGYAQLANEYGVIGRPELGVAPAQQALKLNQSFSVIYLILASSQLHSGDFAAAQKTCELSISRKMDGPDVRHLLLQALASQHDDPGVEAQLQWARGRSDALLLQLDEISLALARGNISRARELLAKFTASPPPPQLQAQYESGLLSVSRMLAEEELPQDSVKTLASLPATAQDENSLVALAEDGDTAKAGAGLDRESQEHGHETLWRDAKAPQVAAAIALANHNPRHALETLRPAQPFYGLAFGPAYLKGEAYLALREPDHALTEFQEIANHPAVEPLSAEYSLAVLAMARAYAMKADAPKAKASYQQFLSLWKTADSDAPLLRAARAELAQLAQTT